MSPAALIVWLGWACYAGALGAIVVYIVHFAGKQSWRRPWNAAGLFFTAIALTQTPAFFLGIYDQRALWRAVVVTVCLLAATGVQAYLALRPRVGGPAPQPQEPAA